MPHIPHNSRPRSGRGAFISVAIGPRRRVYFHSQNAQCLIIRHLIAQSFLRAERGAIWLVQQVGFPKSIRERYRLLE